MKNKLLFQVIMASKYVFYGIMVQCFFAGMLIASNVDAQKIATVKEVFVNLEMEKASVSEIFSAIEKSTDFRFTYYQDGINLNFKVDNLKGRKSVNDILLVVSKEAGLKFRQVNYNINVIPLERNNSRRNNEIEIIINTGQGREISGSIKDTNGEPLLGITVLVKGTTTGTISDMQGNFRLDIPLDAETLVFSFVGMKNLEVAIGNRAVFDVVMEEDVAYLDEIVVVGYGTMRRRDVIGASSAIRGEEIAKSPVSSAAEALIGRMAGVQVSTTEGQPGADIIIKVRGGTSISQDNSPLYIIDGFPSEDGLRNISPSDIERIDVLKDASSTAIYGARGANGVILITTKGGTEGRSNISYDGWAGVRRLGNQLEVLTAPEFVRYQYERQSASESFINRYGPWEYMHRYDDVESINWQDRVLGGSAYYQNHNIAISGGNSTTNYRISYSRDDENGLLVTNGFNRDYFKLRLDQKVTDRLRFSTNAMYSNIRTRGAGTYYGSSTDNALSQLVMYRPTTGLGNPLSQTPIDGELSWEELLYVDEDEVSGLVNIVSQSKSEHRLKLRGNLVMNAAVDYKLVDGLTFRLLGGMTLDNHRDEAFDKIGSRRLRSAGAPFGNIRLEDRKKFNNTALLTYNKTIGNRHSLNLMAGQEYVYDNYQMVQAFSSMYDSDDIGLANLAMGNEHAKPQSREEAVKLLSYFGRAFYSLDNKYQFSGTIRADGSSKFIQDNRWGYFPSASIAWQASEEDVFKNLNIFSNLKFRLTYGVAGNNRISNNQFASTFSNNFYAADGVSHSVGLVPNATANPDLRWESTTSRNFGIDLGFFNDRVSTNIDMYLNTTKDLLLRTNIPSQSGYPTQFKNVGSTENKGIEITLNTRNISTQKFHWNSDFNIAFFKNVVTGLNKEAMFSEESFIQVSGWYTQVEDYMVKVGEPLGLIYGYVTDGFYTVDDFDYNASTQSYTLKDGVAGFIGFNHMPGDLKFKDLSGDPDNPMITPEDDRTIIGRAQPKFFGGLNNAFMYGNFDMSVFVNFVYGNDVLNANKILYSSGYSTNRNLLAVMRGHFTYVNDEGVFVTDPDELREINKDAKIWAPDRSLPRWTHSWAVEDGSFLRINNITMGYTLPSALARKLKIDNLRVFATAYNPFIITNYTGFDPEVSTRRGTPYTPGVDFSAYPKSRSFIGGLNLTF
jgi:TonB-dependent starch-binding outer membrane protein SusC